MGKELESYQIQLQDYCNIPEDDLIEMEPFTRPEEDAMLTRLRKRFLLSINLKFSVCVAELIHNQVENYFKNKTILKSTNALHSREKWLHILKRRLKKRQLEKEKEEKEKLKSKTTEAFQRLKNISKFYLASNRVSGGSTLTMKTAPNQAVSKGSKIESKKGKKLPKLKRRSKSAKSGLLP